MSCIYVLSCENAKYYVGRTIDIVARFNAHQKGFGAKWTQAYKPSSILALVQDGPFVELTTTLQCMKQYGISNVRGGPWVSLVLTQTELSTIDEIMRSEGFGRKETPMNIDETMSTSSSSDVDLSRMGKKWDCMEESNLLVELSQSVPVSNIANSHKRSEGAIRSHVSGIVRKMASEGLTKDTIGRTLNIVDRDVHAALYNKNVELATYLSNA